MLHKRYVFSILVVLWICLIFSFSLQSGEDSSQLSSGFGAWLIEHVLSIFSLDTMSAEQLDMFHFLIRKCAHFTEFFILGVLMYLSTREWLVARRVLIPMVLCTLVAAMDESIQLFVDGRSEHKCCKKFTYENLAHLLKKILFFADVLTERK